jgi:hypothetical protein
MIGGFPYLSFTWSSSFHRAQGTYSLWPCTCYINNICTPYEEKKRKCRKCIVCFTALYIPLGCIGVDLNPSKTI